jgi:phosphoribosylaminoimidazole-succinocarboxamide synthase
MIDKEFIRRWVREQYPDPYKAPKIEISDEMRLKTANRYAQLYEIITCDHM